MTRLLVLAITACGFASPQLRADPGDALADSLPKAVKIFGAGGFRGLEGYGTGFLISPEGHVATVWNHVLDVDPVVVVLDDGRRLAMSVLRADPDRGVAVLAPERDDLNLPFVDLDGVAEARTGDRVFALSNQYGVAAGDEPVSVLHGVVAAVTDLDARSGRYAVDTDGPVLVLDAATNNPGAAGGLLIRQDGVPLGMLGRELRSGESQVFVNYAVPLTRLAPVLADLREGRGPAASDTPPEFASQLRPVDFGLILVPDVVRRTPAYVDQVLPGTAAAAAGLERDDLIVFAGGSIVASVRDLRTALAAAESGDAVDLVVRRGERLVTLSVVTPEVAP